MGSKDRFKVDIQTLNNGVTGSCNFCVVKFPDGSTSRFVVDCGLFQGVDEEKDFNKDFPFNEENIDFVLVTHNHVDHVGRLPLLCKNGFDGKIYSSIPTSKLLPLALYDSCKVVKDVYTRKHEEILYRDTDVQKALSQLEGVPYSQSINVAEHIKATFFKNGHLVGAACILVEISFPSEEKNINIFFTGDFNNKNVFFDVDAIPSWVLELPLTVVQESTYGSINSDSIVVCFEKNILSALENNNTIVIPVFSLGRSQEILHIIKDMQEQGKIDSSIPIYFDGKLARRYTELYLKNDIDIKEEMVDFLPANIVYVDSVIRELVLEDTDSKIIVTTSGMGSYGPAPQYISTFIRQKNALIHFTGYTAEGTLGHRLKTTPIGETVQVAGVFVEKQATVEYTPEFSAHAKADEMIDFLKQFRKINFLLINHGEPEVKESFAKQILKEKINVKDIGIASREYFFRISPYRLVKTLPTKFH